MSRRSRRRRRSKSGPQTRSLSGVPSDAADGRYETWEALRHAQPAWVYSIWRAPQRRAFFAVGWLVLAAITLNAAFSDPPVAFSRRARGVVWAAVAVVPMFGTVLVQALQDLRRNENRVPFFFSIDRLLSSRRGAAAIVLYVAVVVALYLSLPR